MKVERFLLTALILAGITQSRMATAADPGTKPTASAAADITPTTEAAPQSPWGWMKMPSVTMPKVSFPKMPADPLAPIKNSAHKVGDGAKKAWEGTKEMFTFGGSKSGQPVARTASTQEAPSMWKRMFGAKQEENTGPKTVAEFMKQPRPE
jgi:hypothetical protein